MPEADRIFERNGVRFRIGKECYWFERLRKGQFEVLHFGSLPVNVRVGQMAEFIEVYTRDNIEKGAELSDLLAGRKQL